LLRYAVSADELRPLLDAWLLLRVDADATLFECVLVA